MYWKQSMFKLYLPFFICCLLLSPILVTAQGNEKQAITPPGGDFTLQSLEGPVSLHEFSGKVVVLFFGYTGCVDVCPIALSRMEAAFSKMEPDLEYKPKDLLVILINIFVVLFKQPQQV